VPDGLASRLPTGGLRRPPGRVVGRPDQRSAGQRRHVVPERGLGHLMVARLHARCAWVRWSHAIGVYGLAGVRQRLLTLSRVIQAGESDRCGPQTANRSCLATSRSPSTVAHHGNSAPRGVFARRIACRLHDPRARSLLPRPMVSTHRSCSGIGPQTSFGRQPVTGSPSPRPGPARLTNSACSTWPPER
jgi:hypothetical protein